MADSGALRQRRYKAHKANDHRLCRHLRQMPPIGDVAARDPGDLDPVAELQALAGRLEAAHIVDPGNVGVARELRLTLAALMGLPSEDEPDPLAELWASMPPS